MVDDALDEMEFCQNCNKNTLHRTEHERVRGPGVFYRLRVYCRECGRMSRETSFK